MKRLENCSTKAGLVSTAAGSTVNHIGASVGCSGFRVPPTAPTNPVSTTIPGQVLAVPVSVTGSSIAHSPHDLSHSNTGYSATKSEMHTGVQSLSTYTTNLSVNSQGGVVGIDTGRPMVATQVSSGIVSPQVGLNATQGAAVHPPHVIHTANAAVRPPRVHQVGGNNIIHPVTTLGANAATVAACAAVTANHQVSGQYQRLKVEDALSYLDQVKVRFGRQPQVYNDFLDIMKEFKSQSIDTPGVIARVSHLFRGHPELVVGFNTFLPPGYKIEVHGEEQVSVSIPGQQTTVVHTPQGIHHVTPSAAPPQPTVPPSITVNAAPSIQGPLGPIIRAPTVTGVNQISSSTPTTVLPPTVVGSTTTGGALSVSVNPSSAAAVLPASVIPPAPPPNGPHASSVPAVTAAVNCVDRVPGSTPPTSTAASATAHGNTPVSAPAPNSAAAPPSTPSVPSLHHLHQSPAQPVEFNHAINYVNKIKLRFQGQPDIYKQFLEILHTYQKEQKHIKEGVTMPARTLTESEVYEKVAKLFENQEDLLQEFGQFLPDATHNTAAQAAVSDFMDQYRSNNNKSLSNDHGSSKKSAGVKNALTGPNNLAVGVGSMSSPNNATAATLYAINHSLKRPLPPATHASSPHALPPVKKPKLSYLKDMSAAEAGKFATLSEYAFFDKVRKALRHEETYYNFLRCITLFNEEIISRGELVQIIHPFLSKFPDLLSWFKEFVGFQDGVSSHSDIIPASVAKQERISGDLAMEIDYTTCKRLGASYCALPKSYPQPKCSGRTLLCKEVLNDTWVSFPSWSEDSTFVTSRKTQYEEYIYRCEDERFELDVVLETNLATIRVLESVQKRLQRMSPEEAARFRLDDALGGSSPTVSQRAIKRIYGDKAPDILDGLKKNPVVAVPLVLRRLKAKDEEWREAQKGFNKIWREQNERYYLKSLDHQGLTFKQNDIKMLRSKSLLNDIETLYDERHEHAEESGEVITGPHVTFRYKDKSSLDDAAALIIHHVKRQTTIHKEDKAKIKQLVRQFVPDLFFHPRMDMSDDEPMDDDEDDVEMKPDIKSLAKSENNNLKESSSKRANSPSETSASPLHCGSETNARSPTGTKRKTRSGKGIGGDADKEPPPPAKEPPDISAAGAGASDASDGSAAPSPSSATKPLLNGDISDSEKSGVGKSTAKFVAVKAEEAIKPESPKEEPKLQPYSVASSSYADDEYRLFIGDNHWYLFMHLHNILCQRLTTMYEAAVRIAAEDTKERRDRKESTAVALRLKPKNEIPVEEYYPTLLDMVQNMLDGNLESSAFEDTLRDMFGIHAYQAFTIDKVVNGAVRQLQHIVCDELPSQCTSEFLLKARAGGAGGPMASAHHRIPLEQAYQRGMEKALQDENCFKMYSYKRDTRLTFELLDTESDESTGTATSNGNNGGHAGEAERGGGDNPDDYSYAASGVNSSFLHTIVPSAVAEVERWSEYVQKYISTESAQLSPAMQARLCRKPVFLPRNLRSWKKEAYSKRASSDGNYNDSSMDIVDNTQCKFNLSTFKMVFVVNSDSFMYKKDALGRAKKSHPAVSKRMKRQFDARLTEWKKENVLESEETQTNQWLLGQTPGLRPNKTKINKIEPGNSTAPYAPYNKYECESPESETS